MMRLVSQSYYLVFPESDEPPAGVTGNPAHLGYCAAAKIAGFTGRASGVLPLSEFANRYWYISAPGQAFLQWPFDQLAIHNGTLDSEILTYYYAASTEEIEYILRRGFSVDAIDGPFDTREEAAYSLDLFWKAPDGDWNGGGENG
jgi:hypothetical protein